MNKLCDSSLCSGCGACYSICPKKAIKMKENTEGFLYPEIDKSLCINCGLCEKSCPILNKTTYNNMPQCFACYNKDENTRVNSSSGGIFTLLASEILNRGGVVCGAAFDDDFMVSHQFISSIDTINILRNSKYLQSRIDDAYKNTRDFLEEGKYVLFTGTPCQIEGLLSFLGKKYEKLFTQDVVCHGVPSPKVWRKYLKFREERDNSIPIKINFRDKKQEGWKLFSLSFQYLDSEYAENQKRDIFMRAFLKDICLRESCYRCSFRKTSRASDITLADYWGIQKKFPQMDDNKGISLVLINSNKGKLLFDLLQNRIEAREVTLDDAIMSNRAIIKSPPINRYRKKFFEQLDKKDFDVLVHECTPNPILIHKIAKKVKKLLRK